MTKFPLDQYKPVDHPTVSAFVAEFMAGHVNPSVKSEKIPTIQDEPVFVLVADEFDKVTSDTKKDMFIEFYAPWCGQ